MSLTVYKRELAFEIFVRTADENYVAARWCEQRGLYYDFNWLALHAIEKYAKASLLLNGETTKGYGHDIAKLYAAVKHYARELLPDKLVRPSQIYLGFWIEIQPEVFIDRLMRYGSPANRYGIFGYQKIGQELHMLDALVFAIRRLCCDLDARYWEHSNPQIPKDTNREVLLRNPNWFKQSSMLLDRLISSEGDPDLRHAALNANFAFAPADYPHSFRSGSGFLTPVILRTVLDPLGSDDAATAAHGIELAEWLLANVQVPGKAKERSGVHGELLNAIDAARTKHGLPKPDA